MSVDSVVEKTPLQSVSHPLSCPNFSGSVGTSSAVSSPVRKHRKSLSLPLELGSAVGGVRTVSNPLAVTSVIHSANSVHPSKTPSPRPSVDIILAANSPVIENGQTSAVAQSDGDRVDVFDNSTEDLCVAETQQPPTCSNNFSTTENHLNDTLYTPPESYIPESPPHSSMFSSQLSVVRDLDGANSPPAETAINEESNNSSIWRPPLSTNYVNVTSASSVGVVPNDESGDLLRLDLSDSDRGSLASVNNTVNEDLTPQSQNRIRIVVTIPDCLIVWVEVAVVVLALALILSIIHTMLLGHALGGKMSTILGPFLWSARLLMIC